MKFIIKIILQIIAIATISIWYPENPTFTETALAGILLVLNNIHLEMLFPSEK